MALVLLALGFQLVVGSLHAAGPGHDPTGECQVCLTLDRLDPAVPSVGATPVCARADATAAKDEPASIPSSGFRLYAVRAPPAFRRF